MRGCAIGLALSAMVYAGTAHAGASPEDVAKAFCAARVASSEDATRKLLSTSLIAVIEEAEKRNDAAQAAAPDDKPPLGDGIPYQSFQDAVEACVPGKTTAVGSVTETEVVYSYVGAPDAGWKDVLLLSPGGDGFVIDDIRLLGSPDGSDAVTLRDVLNSAFDQ